MTPRTGSGSTTNTITGKTNLQKLTGSPLQCFKYTISLCFVFGNTVQLAKLISKSWRGGERPFGALNTPFLCVLFLVTQLLAKLICKSWRGALQCFKYTISLSFVFGNTVQLAKLICKTWRGLFSVNSHYPPLSFFWSLRYSSQRHKYNTIF